MNYKLKKLWFVLLLFCVFADTVIPVKAAKWPIDTSIETSREAGTDLYEAVICHNVLPISVSSSTGESMENLIDASYSTAITLPAGTVLTVSSETPMFSVYITWDCLVPEWKLQIGEQTYTYGQNGFLHEYVVLPEPTTSFSIIMGNCSTLGDGLPGVFSGSMRLTDIYAFPDENIPSWVQIWNPPTDEADMLLLITHSDDEEIFFGGFIPTYAGEEGLRVQVAYFISHWNNRIREHEKLDGLWVSGGRYYPITSHFSDGYSSTLEAALQTISADDANRYVTNVIRRTHPLVVVLHDINGEYGHGQHRLSSYAGRNAVTLAAVPEYRPEDVALYGTWSVPKVYIHLYGENRIKMDLRRPLENFGGKTAIQVSRQAFLCHQSQKNSGYTVDDYGNYSNAIFGLYKTEIGADLGNNDVMDNLRGADISAIRLAASSRTTQMPSPTPTSTPISTDTPIPTATPVPTETPTPTATPVPTETPTPTATPVPTPTPTPTAAPVPTSTLTPTPTETPVPSPTETPSPVPTDIPPVEKESRTGTMIILCIILSALIATFITFNLVKVIRRKREK